MYDYGPLLEENPDENFVIGFWTGSPIAIDKMLKKISEMHDSQILVVWETLRKYDPRNYYDKEGKIGMDTWADAIRGELDRRPHLKPS